MERVLRDMWPEPMRSERREGRSSWGQQVWPWPSCLSNTSQVEQEPLNYSSSSRPKKGTQASDGRLLVPWGGRMPSLIQMLPSWPPAPPPIQPHWAKVTTADFSAGHWGRGDLSDTEATAVVGRPGGGSWGGQRPRTEEGGR